MKLSSIMKHDLSYNPERKKQFNTAAKRCLRKLTTELGLEKGQYDLRVNEGGIAVSGEVTLHTDTVYVQVAQTFLGDASQVLFRTCSGRKDYTGGQNWWTSAEFLEDNPKRFAEKLKALVERGNKIGVDLAKERWAETMWR